MTSNSAQGKTLIVHIGDHKTGSTTIQKAFATGSVTLAGKTLVYPSDFNHNFLPAYLKFQGSGPKAARAPARRKRVNELARKLRESDADFGVVSAENLEDVKPAVVQKLLENEFAGVADDLRIICYVRPHAARLVSSHAEQLKIGTFDGDLQGFFRRKKLFYAPRLEAWRKAFGDRFILRPLVRPELAGGDVLEDFIHHAFGTGDFTIAPLKLANESLSLRDLILVRCIQEKLSEMGGEERTLRHPLGWALARQLGKHVPAVAPEKLQMHRSLAETMVKTYGKDARAVDEAFFDGRPILQTELENAVAKALPEPQSMRVEDHFSAEEQRSIAVMADMILFMMKNNPDSWGEFLRKTHVASMRGKITG